jgi:hypothetical protein
VHAPFPRPPLLSVAPPGTDDAVPVFRPPRFTHVPFTLAKRPAEVPDTCGACGGPVGARPRLCSVLGIWCCAACHSGGTAVVPAHVLQYWDFTPYVDRAACACVYMLCVCACVRLCRVRVRMRACASVTAALCGAGRGG